MFPIIRHSRFNISNLKLPNGKIIFLRDDHLGLGPEMATNITWQLTLIRRGKCLLYFLIKEKKKYFAGGKIYIYYYSRLQEGNAL